MHTCHAAHRKCRVDIDAAVSGVTRDVHVFKTNRREKLSHEQLNLTRVHLFYEFEESSFDLCIVCRYVSIERTLRGC